MSRRRIVGGPSVACAVIRTRSSNNAAYYRASDTATSPSFIGYTRAQRFGGEMGFVPLSLTARVPMCALQL